ncbi:MAG TPA: hypothetical protein VHL10_00915, partial [Nitrososphaera sp.]|nr:hypothetical protein [Nitrososphaera sp.]
NGGVAANNGSSLAAAYSEQGWNTSTSDLTGTQTLTLKVTSDATTSTQTVTLHSYVIRKISTT